MGNMPTVCRPSLSLPDHVVDLDDVVLHMQHQHSEHPRLGTALRLMRSTSVARRHLIDPLEIVTTPRTFGQRMRRYAEEGTRLGVSAAKQALDEADTVCAEIDNLIVVSCTGYLLPGLDAYIANQMGLESRVRRLSFTQVGCAGGAYSLARAQELHKAHTGAVTLIVAVELSSLSYQAGDSSIASFVSTALFGDAAAAVVIRDDRPGFQLNDAYEDLTHDSLGHISYVVDELGFHFDTNPRISRIVANAMPQLKEWLGKIGGPVDPEFLISHTGGPRIMHEVSKGLQIPTDMFRLSEKSLQGRGNTASVVVFDVLRQTFEDPPEVGDSGLIIAFGPGVTTVAVTGSWVG
ncbi:type III polyketide synthase [Streptomyces sp. NPDC101227]|uniref:type III polyketide synthase n=1 Tax=Streptomyces sp. NPDC101227 TaxID=3366136 RepID=UPI0037F9BE5E